MIKYVGEYPFGYSLIMCNKSLMNKEHLFCTFACNSDIMFLFGGVFMFDFFKSSKNAVLDDIILRLNMNMSNNYKDAAQSNLKELEENFSTLKSAGKLNEKQIKHYEDILNEYREKMKNYSHKDQKPFWV